ncbi:MAG: hypothetical protein D6694_03755, partial [Gammaproteobacteria bacterium]
EAVFVRDSAIVAVQPKVALLPLTGWGCNSGPDGQPVARSRNYLLVLPQIPPEQVLLLIEYESNSGSDIQQKTHL